MTRSEKNILFDYYGALLSEKQRECFDLYFNEDLSLSEIAEIMSITRQGAWDNIRKAQERLCEIEEKTGLVARISELEAELDSRR